MRLPPRFALALLPLSGPLWAANSGGERFAGALPCADCAALVVELALLPEGRYEERRTYVDRGASDIVAAEKGAWSRIERASPDGRPGYRLRPDGVGEQRTFLVHGPRSLRAVDARGMDLPSPWPQVQWRSDRDIAGPEVRVAEADASRPVRLAAGQRLRIRLPSNPSTGHRWSLAGEPPVVVSLAATPRFEPGKAPVLGAPGHETWRWLASRPGRGTLRLRYSQPHEPRGDFREVAFAIEVAEPS